MGIPVIAIIVGFVSLLINHNEKNKKLLVCFLVIGLLATCFLGVMSNISPDKKSIKQETKLNDLSKDNSKLIQKLTNFQNDTGNYKDTHRNKSQNYFFGCSLSWVSC